jgi:hypothetical protein
MTSAMARARIHYDGRRFTPVGDHDSGAAGPASGTPRTVGVYHQDGDLVWAEFSGPTARVGRLVGACDPDGVITAGYCMIQADGSAMAGTCRSVPTVLADGRVRLTEHWRRVDGSTGVSTIEEIIE